MPKLATAKLLIEAGLSRSFANHVMAGTRKVGMPLAIWLHDERGIIVEPLVGKNKRHITMLRDIYGAEPPASIQRRVAANDSASSEKAA